jgi:protein ImuA
MKASRELIDKLQQDILLWQGFKPQTTGKADAIGLGAIEAAFPEWRLSQKRPFMNFSPYFPNMQLPVMAS